jgi:uncharacterized RDD family membrane protein YckC
MRTTGGEYVTDGLTGDGTKRRVFAMAVDNLAAMTLAALVGSNAPVADGQVRGVLAVLCYLAYYFVQEGTWSTTIGKRLFGLTVRGIDGSPARWHASGIRTVTRLVEVNPLILGVLPGGLLVAFSKRHQRLGDMLAGTVVVPSAAALPTGERAAGFSGR